MQYDNPVAELQDHLATANISSTTVDAINSLLGLNEEGATVNLATFDGVNLVLPESGTANVVTGVVVGNVADQVTVDLSAAQAAGANVFVLESDANLVVNVAASQNDQIITTGNGDDVITVGDQNVVIDAGNGNDTIITGNGNNTVIAGAGNNYVKTGSGTDTVILSGSNHADVVDTGAGFDVVQLDGSRDAYNFAVGNNFNVNLTGNQTAQISNAEFLTFANGDTVALAQSEDEAAALRLYQGLLGRDADLEGTKAFVGAVNSGTSLTDIANAFLNSSEFTSKVNAADINELYQALLGRDADAAGAADWQAVLANGGSLNDVAAAIAQSSEALQLDQSNATFVRELYENVLGRDADQDGLDAWVAQLFNGTSRTDVVQSFLGSTEAGLKSDSDFIDSLYQSALGRTADEAGKADWQAALANGASHTDVALAIVGSAEAVEHNDNVVVLHGQV
ncbi:DUF4214 domain-containing protein [Pseudomonas sp. LRP2-20]|uniref:DUF4214 domain-containing protein n=1 Tax=Pseudomonas sp. LRP2-20 TaxID=2944234 RepID=UPI00218AB207|nr:DUF4214 domain-containing protein [Pseudomonas sp. LRP2-20]BDM24245.1 DUF4214 domain-containing protein [Pseudomonas sp. LRP2-20]